MSGTITESLRNIELVRRLELTYPEIRRLRGHTEAIYEVEMGKVRKIRTLSFSRGHPYPFETINPLHLAMANI